MAIKTAYLAGGLPARFASWYQTYKKDCSYEQPTDYKKQRLYKMILKNMINNF